MGSGVEQGGRLNSEDIFSKRYFLSNGKRALS